MKVVKESLLLNDLAATMDATKAESLLIMRNDATPVVMMTIDTYNQLKADAYKDE